MSFDNKALIKAAAIGAGVGLLLGIFRSIPFVSLGCCCLGWLVYMGVGALYGYLAEQNNNPVDLGSFTLGGAIGGGVTGLVWGIVVGVIQAILYMLGVGIQSAQQSLQMLQEAGFEVPPEVGNLLTSAGGMSVMGILSGICTGLIFGAVMGAVGGLIYSLIKQGSRGSSARAAGV